MAPGEHSGTPPLWPLDAHSTPWYTRPFCHAAPVRVRGGKVCGFPSSWTRALSAPGLVLVATPGLVSLLITRPNSSHHSPLLPSPHQTIRLTLVGAALKCTWVFPQYIKMNSILSLHLLDFPWWLHVKNRFERNEPLHVVFVTNNKICYMILVLHR